MKNKTELFLYKEAAKYLNLTEEEFLSYANQGLLCYKLVFNARIYSLKELNRFKKEVLSKQKVKV